MTKDDVTEAMIEAGVHELSRPAAPGLPGKSWPHSRVAAVYTAMRAADPKLELAKDALAELEQTEARYRYAHDILGAGDPKTGRAWDLMKRAGDKARAALAKINGSEQG